ncbi:MAG: hypothetical protein KF764_00495 [Labilithrix sp.]|nr:hypothetical protein [Labilithrix sp.]
MSDAVYEMLWDCRYCGQDKLLGLTHRFCARCGAPQDPARRYFPPEHEKVAVHQHAYVGADVHCPACRQPMSRAARCCTNCGSPIDRGAEVAHAGAPPPAVAPPRPPAPPRKSKVGLIIGIVLAVLGSIVLLFIALIVVGALWTRQGSLEVTGHTWERSVAIERYENVPKDVWCDSVPAGARELSRRKEERNTRKVAAGETCENKKVDNRDGTYRETRECTTNYREESIDDWRCRIEVAEWRPRPPLVEKGTSPDDPPKWPTSPARTGTCIGCEREGKRTERYTVTFHDATAKKDADCVLPEDRWKTFKTGARYTGKVGVLTDRVDCDELTPR